MVMGKRDGDLGPICVPYQKIEVQLAWSTQFSSVFGQPSVLDPQLQPSIHPAARTSLLSALEQEYPELVSVWNPRDQLARS